MYFFPCSYDPDEAIESLLLPVLAQVPSPELYNLPSSPTPSSGPPAVPSSPPPSPSHNQLSGCGRTVVRTLEYCYEKLPQPLPVDREIGETVQARLMEEMSICSQKDSVADYHAHVYHMVSKDQT